MNDTVGTLRQGPALIMKNDTHWLQEEIGLWVSEGIISAAQAERLRVRLAERRQHELTVADRAATANEPAATTPRRKIHWGPLLVNAIGVIVIGLGIILFFAYNWASMSKWAKLAVVFGGVAGAHAIGLWLDRHRAADPSQGLHRGTGSESFHLLGTMLFGAGIFLVSQIYHFGSHYPNAFLIWGLGATAMAWAMPSVILGVLASVLLGVWGLSEQLRFDDYHWQSPLLAGVLLLPLAWRLRSSALLSTSLLLSLILALVAVADYREAIVLPVLLLLGIGMTLSGQLLPIDNWQFARKPVHRLGLLVYGFTLMVLAFDSRPAYFRSLTDTGVVTADRIVQWLVLLAMALTAAACLAWWWRMRSTADPQRSTQPAILDNLRWHAFVMAGVTLLVIAQSLGWLRDAIPANQVISSLLIGAHGVLLILRGTDTTDWKRTTLGCLLIAVALIGRFFELFDSLLLRALAFVLMGAGLVTVGVLYQRKRQRDDSDAGESAEAPVANQHDDGATDHA